MVSQVAQSEASISNELSQVQRTKYKGRNHASYRPKKKKEFEGLTAENSYLKEIIESLIANYSQIPARNKQENSLSHSANGDYDPNFYVQGPQLMDSDEKGTAEKLLSGLGLNDLLDDLVSGEMAINGPVSQTSLCQTKTNMAEFILKIDEDVARTVDLSNFTGLEGDRKTIGRYSFPLSLVPTVERIINAYGDVAAASLMNANVTGTIYILFCATIKEMGDLGLEQVTEEKMLKWRDAIKDALRINFKVEFAMNHLKKIARAYFGRVGCQVLHGIDEKLNALHKERLQRNEEFKECLADAKDFNGKSVSTGLFQY